MWSRGSPQLAVAAASFATWLVAGCGGAPAAPSPTGPSHAAAQLSQFPAIVGEWVGSAGLAMQYRSPDVSASSYCGASLSIREQSQGTFSGVGGLNGSSLNTDKQCPGSFAFTATMTPDGTIVSFKPDQRFRTEECLAVSDVSLTSGTASAAGFRIELTDRAMCRWPPYDVNNPFARETNRTWAMTIDVRRGVS